MQGWIKLHRKFIEWEWYKDSNTKLLFLHLILKANHKDGKWHGLDIKKGELITGRKVLSAETGLSEQSIRTSLNKLKLTKELTIKTTNKNSLITILNYNLYQNELDTNQQLTNEPTNEQPTTNQQLTTNKNVKNNKNANNEKDADQNADNNHVFIQITKDNMWIEAMCMNHRTDPEILIGHLRKFYWHCLSNDNFKSNTSDAKKHFNNWINRENPVPKRKLTATFEGFE